MAVENQGRNEQKPSQENVSIGLVQQYFGLPNNQAIRQDSHHQSTQASDGAHEGESDRAGNGGSPLQIALRDEAMVAIHSRPVVIAIVDVHAVNERCPLGRIGAHRGKPKDGHQEVEGEYRPDVVQPTRARDLFGDEGVRNDYPSHQPLRTSASASRLP